MFFHENYIEQEVEDVYKLPANRRTALRIVLATGRKIAGTLLDDAGKPRSGVMVKAIGGRGTRKTTLTDAEGAFHLSGLPKGEITLMPPPSTSIRRFACRFNWNPISRV